MTMRRISMWLASAGLALSGIACSDTTEPTTASPTPDAGPISEAGPKVERAPFVLLHGAWMGAWSWEGVEADLRTRGEKVTVVELPAHGSDTTPATEVTLDGYVAKVGATIDAAPVPVVLVAHSMGGIVATQVADTRAKKIAKLVYVAAYVPKDGETLQTLAGTDKESLVGPALKIDPTKGVASLPLERLTDIFCGDCTASQSALLSAKYKDEPIAPFAAPIKVRTEAWGTVPKYYVFTKQDRAVTYGLQQQMTKDVTWAKTTTLETSHTPFLAEPTTFTKKLLETIE